MKRIVECAVFFCIGVGLHHLLITVQDVEADKIRTWNSRTIAALGDTAAVLTQNTNLLMGWSDPSEPEGLADGEYDTKPGSSLVDDAAEICRSVQQMTTHLLIQRDRIIINSKKIERAEHDSPERIASATPVAELD